MKPEAVRAIWFDLDDTLYDSAPVYEAGLRRAHRRFAAEHPGCWDEFRRLYRVARANVKQAIPASTSVHSRLLYFKRLVEARTGRCRPALTLAMDQAYSEAFEEIPSDPALTVLTALAADRPLGLLTNQLCETQLQKLCWLDPDGALFSWVVTSEEVGADKPAPAMFEEAARRCGMAPADLLIVGDDWTNDIEPALALGWQAVLVSASGGPEGVPRIASIADLPGLLVTP